MATRTAHVEWTGDFREGLGIIKPGSGTFEAGYSYGSIFQDAAGTNPVEILAASLAGCFSGALAALLTRNNFSPKRIGTDATVRTKPAGVGFTIAGIDLYSRAEVPGIDEDTFRSCVEAAKLNCPVALALGAIEITVQADLG